MIECEWMEDGAVCLCVSRFYDALDFLLASELTLVFI